MSNNPRRNHHILPRHYLKGFSIQDNQSFIWVYHRGQKYNPGTQKSHYNPCLKPLSTAGVIRDFYSQTNILGTTDYDTLEKQLELHERPAQPIIDKIRDRQSITTNEKAILAEYIMLTWKRGEFHRSDPLGLWENTRETTFKDVFDEFYSNPQKFADDHKFNGTPEQVEEFLKVLYSESSDSDRMKQMILNQTILSTNGQMSEHLSKVNWIFAINAGDSPFLTSDMPVYFNMKAGLKKSDLTFPISSDILLLATKNNLKEGYFSMPDSYVRVVNRRTVNLAVSYLFASINDKWIVNMANKGRYHERYLVEP